MKSFKKTFEYNKEKMRRKVTNKSEKDAKLKGPWSRCSARVLVKELMKCSQQSSKSATKMPGQGKGPTMDGKWKGSGKMRKVKQQVIIYLSLTYLLFRSC